MLSENLIVLHTIQRLVVIVNKDKFGNIIFHIGFSVPMIDHHKFASDCKL